MLLLVKYFLVLRGRAYERAPRPQIWKGLATADMKGSRARRYERTLRLDLVTDLTLRRLGIKTVQLSGPNV